MSLHRPFETNEKVFKLLFKYVHTLTENFKRELLILSPFAFSSCYICTIQTIRQELSLTLSQKGQIIFQNVFHYLNTHSSSSFYWIHLLPHRNLEAQILQMSCLQCLSPFSLEFDGWTPVLMTQLCCTSTSCWGHDGITENDLVFILSHTLFALLLSVLSQQVNITSPQH